MLLHFSTLSLLFGVIVCFNKVVARPVPMENAAFAPRTGGDFNQPSTERFPGTDASPANTLNTDAVNGTPPPETPVSSAPNPVRTIGVFNRAKPDASISLFVISTVQPTHTFAAAISPTSFEEKAKTTAVQATETSAVAEENTQEITSELKEEPTATEIAFENTSAVTPVSSFEQFVSITTGVPTSTAIPTTGTSEQPASITTSFTSKETSASSATKGTVTAKYTSSPPTRAITSAPQVTQQSSPVNLESTPVSPLREIANSLQQMLSILKRQPPFI